MAYINVIPADYVIATDDNIAQYKHLGRGEWPMHRALTLSDILIKDLSLSATIEERRKYHETIEPLPSYTAPNAGYEIGMIISLEGLLRNPFKEIQDTEHLMDALYEGRKPQHEIESLLKSYMGHFHADILL